MGKKLVAYFSASGVTRDVAQKLAEAANADLYEITPEVPYTEADLDWRDENARSTVEMNQPSFRPAITGRVENMEKYDTVFVGFPIWWYVAPTIINTFLESYDLTGKKIVPFATSGGSGMGETNQKLKASCGQALLIDGKILNSGMSRDFLAAWVDELRL